MTESNLNIARDHLDYHVGEKLHNGLVTLHRDKLVPYDVEKNAFVIMAAGILEMPKVGDLPVKDYWNNFMDTFFRNGTDCVVDPYGSLCAVVAANSISVDDEGILKRCLENHLAHGMITGQSGNKAKYLPFYVGDNAMAALAINNTVLARQVAHNSVKYFRNSAGILICNAVERDDRPGHSFGETLAENALAVLALLNVKGQGYLNEAETLFSNIERALENCELSSEPHARILIYMASLELKQQQIHRHRKSYSSMIEGMGYGYDAEVDALQSIALGGRTISDATKRR